MKRFQGKKSLVCPFSILVTSTTAVGSCSSLHACQWLTAVTWFLGNQWSTCKISSHSTSTDNKDGQELQLLGSDYSYIFVNQSFNGQNLVTSKQEFTLHSLHNATSWHCLLQNGPSVWTVLVMWEPQMSFELDAGDKLLPAVFTHKLFIAYVLTDVPPQSFQLLICLWTPLTSRKWNNKN